MLASCLPGQQTHTIIPNSGVQFLDTGFNVSRLQSYKGRFAERTRAGEDGTAVTLDILRRDAQAAGLVSTADGKPAPESDVFSVAFTDALEALQGRWLPAPFFKEKGRDASGTRHFEEGPSNWVRMCVVALDEPDADDNTHRVTFAIDTALSDPRDADSYVGPLFDDAKHEAQFGFAAAITSNSWFLDQPWIEAWLKQGVPSDGSIRNARRPTAAWAFFVTLLGGLEQAGVSPRLKLIDTLSTGVPRKPVEVDLVLDIGNSRTCGVLIEDPELEGLNLADASTLQLRDLSDPTRLCAEPFRSHVEFHRVSFGDNALSRDSGRANAFSWPSLVRVGPEAVRLDGRRVGAEGPSGISGPKRYLWDEAAADQPWMFNPGHTADAPGVVYGDLMNLLTAEGNVLDADDGLEDTSGEDAEPALEPRFSRSSLFTLMLVEIVFHALAQVNSIAHRRKSKSQNVPRRLRRVILTIPTGTPLVERQLFEKRARHARALLLELLDLETAEDGQPPLSFDVWLDEATCTQMVYLYAEIARRFGRKPDAVVKALGRTVQGGLRVASLDIGGGTTDLMVMTYRVAQEGGRTLHPEEDFREGFRRAGDDILRAVTAQIVLPAVARHLRSCGLSDGGQFIETWMTETGRSALTRHKRKLFTTQVLVPMGLAILRAHEHQGLAGNYGQRRSEPLNVDADAVLSGTQADILADFEEAAREAGAVDFRLRDVALQTSGLEIEQALASELDQMLAALCRVVNELGCDILLLSGRPSRLPALTELLLRHLPVSPHRILPMHQYRVGSWYPFASSRGVVDDPKTTVVVGALICTLGNEMRLQDFSVDMRSFGAQSTARILGQMEADTIPASAVIFDDTRAPDVTESDPVSWDARTFIGFRQVRYERWPATPLYCVSRARDADPKYTRMRPWYVTFRRPEQPDPDLPGARLGRPERLSILEIQGGEDRDRIPSEALECRLQTMTELDGYWLDTGFIDFTRGLADDA